MNVIFVILFCFAAVGFVTSPEKNRFFALLLGIMIVLWCIMMYSGGYLTIKYW